MYVLMIYDDYISYTSEYKKEYGEKTLVLIEVGSFWELYDCDKRLGADAKAIGELLNIQVSKKNKSIPDASAQNPYMAGFPTPALQKFLPILLESGYTVVLVSQVTPPPNPKRAVTHVYSKGTQIENVKSSSNYIMAIYVEEGKDLRTTLAAFSVGVAVVDVSAGRPSVYESYSSQNDIKSPLDDVCRLVSSFSPCEIMLIGSCSTLAASDVFMHCGIDTSRVKTYDMLNCYPKEVHNLHYQNHIIEHVYVDKKNMLSGVEYVGLERHINALAAFVSLIRFVYKHNEGIVKHMHLPKWIDDRKTMKLSYNAAQQLDLDGLCNIINRSVTSQGKRYFKHMLFNPVAEPAALEKSYAVLAEMCRSPHHIDTIRTHLANVYDTERLFRKVLLQKLQPCEISCLLQSIDSLENIMNTVKCSELLPCCITVSESICQVKQKFLETIDIDRANRYNIDEIKGNIFKCGLYNEIDSLEADLKSQEDMMVVAVKELHQFKLESNDRDGYFLVITTKRMKELSKSAVLSKRFDVGCGEVRLCIDDCKHNTLQSNYVKLTSDALRAYTNKRTEMQETLSSQVRCSYMAFLESLSSMSHQFGVLTDAINHIDYVATNARNALDFCYSKPVISASLAPQGSFVRAKQVRHPIIERVLNKTQYVPNDVCLGMVDKEHFGMLLYGLNAAGKSSLMKAVGLSLIMAQSGMFVPASSFEYSPYESLFTRIHRNDNLYAGQSTFMVEMGELRNILKRADNKSIVLGDEICSGTESASAVAIVAAGVLGLCKRASSFIFATHLHDLTHVPEIKSNGAIKVCHLHVEYDADTHALRYDRTLRDGQGSSVYGIEVCRALDMGKEFIETANRIRCEHIGLADVFTPKRSRYNSELLVDVCGVCGATAEEVHHIQHQKDADSNGKIGIVHKNHKSNLVGLCAHCHDSVHNGSLSINGYITTGVGVQLDVQKANMQPHTSLEEAIIELKKAGKSVSAITKELGTKATVYKVNKVIKSYLATQ